MSGLYTKLAAGVLFPLHERLKGHDSVALRRSLERSEWFSADQLAALRLTKLRAFLQHVNQSVPYYRDLFARIGFEPASIASLDDLGRLPFLTKPLIRQHSEALKAIDAGPLKRYNTGGSSGEPLVFYIGKDRVTHDVAAKWRATRWWGVDIGDPEIVVWGSPIELGAQDRVRAVRDRVLRTSLLAAFEMSDANLDRFVAQIRAVRPRMLFGYPSALAHIAAHADKRGIAMTDIGVQVAFVTSEKLYDHQRAQIAKTFGCRVANGYGGRDAGFIAHECPSGSMHLTAEDIIVETVGADDRPTSPGTSGEIVVTHLATREFPFIRYRTGDVGVLGSGRCSCGRGLPVLQEVQGRSTDFVVAQNGTVMHGLALIYVIRDLAGVRQFKIIQERLDLVRVLLVVDAQFDRKLPDTIRHTFKLRLGEGVEVPIELVDEIKPERSGKFRYVVSAVTPGRESAQDVASAARAESTRKNAPG